MTSRAVWTDLSDAQLLGQCEVDTYRASGPGGQKRNKTSSAVRLRHLPSGLVIIAEESRSQHENRDKALRRLRQALYLQIREEVQGDQLKPEGMESVLEVEGRLRLGRKDPRYWPAVGVILDVLQATESRVSDTARILGVSTGNLIDFLQSDPKVWEQANRLRVQFGHKPLR